MYELAWKPYCAGFIAARREQHDVPQAPACQRPQRGASARSRRAHFSLEPACANRPTARRLKNGAPLPGDAPGSQPSKYGSRLMSCTETCSRIFIITGARSGPVTAPEGIRPMPHRRCKSHDVPLARVVRAPSAAAPDTVGSRGPASR